MKTRELILIGVFLTALAGLIWFAKTNKTESQPDHVLEIQSTTQEAPTAAIKPTEAPIIFTESHENAVISVSEAEPEEVIVEEVETATEPTEAAEVQDVVVEEEPENNMEYLGTFTVTAYCSCVECAGQWAGGPTASGTYPSEGWTCACNAYPFGTMVYIDGVGERCIEDRGDSNMDDTWIDLYFEDHEAAQSFGMQYLDVYLITE